MLSLPWFYPKSGAITMHTQFSTRGTESKQMNTIVLRTSAKLTNIYVLYFTIMLPSISKIKSKRKHLMNIHSFLGNPPTGYRYALVMKIRYQQINNYAVNKICFGYYLSLYLYNVYTIQTFFSKDIGQWTSLIDFLTHWNFFSLFESPWG